MGDCSTDTRSVTSILTPLTDQMIWMMFRECAYQDLFSNSFGFARVGSAISSCSRVYFTIHLRHTRRPL